MDTSPTGCTSCMDSVLAAGSYGPSGVAPVARGDATTYGPGAEPVTAGGPAAVARPRADGHCCDACAHDAQKRAAYGSNPMLSIVHGVSPGAGSTRPRTQPYATGAGGPYPLVDPAASYRAPAPSGAAAVVFAPVPARVFLRLQGLTPVTWLRLRPEAQVRHVVAFERRNPGAVRDAEAFATAVDAYAHGRALAPSGDIAIPSGLTAGDWVPYGTTTAGWAIDDLGNYVSIDASGHPIQGTVREGADPNSAPINDSDLDLPSLEFVSGSDTTDTGPGGSASSTSTPAAPPDPATRAAWSAVNGLIGAAGTDIAAIIAANNRTELARINADLQLALRSGQASNGARLTPDEVAQLQRVNGYLNPPQTSPVVTAAAVGGVGIGLAVLAKAAGWI